MNVLSLFDGMSCGRIALERLGICPINYFSSEIDKYCIQVSQHNYPDTTQLGSVVDVSSRKLPKINLLLGGSPCQGFSIAGSKLNFEHPQSKLFFEFVRLLEEIKPDYFLLENVRMRKEYLDIITKRLGVGPIMINSARFSAQSRSRWYWTNLPTSKYRRSSTDSNRLVTDILEEQVPNRYYIKSDKKFIWSNGGNGVSQIGYIGRDGQGNRVYSVYGKAISLCASSGGLGPKTGLYAVPIDRLDELPEGNPYRVKDDSKSPFLEPIKCLVRKLTPIECERLQTVPDEYTDCVSEPQRLKMLGNGWTVDVIVHLLSSLKT